MQPDDGHENPGAIRMAASHDTADADADPGTATGTAHGDIDVSLFADADELDARWTDIQADFVDDPRRAIEEADELVADVLDRVTSRFAEQRSMLEGQWRRGDDVTTEQLRLALRHYRSFFRRLLST
jgi:hypothetical protein